MNIDKVTGSGIGHVDIFMESSRYKKMTLFSEAINSKMKDNQLASRVTIDSESDKDNVVYAIIEKDNEDKVKDTITTDSLLEYCNEDNLTVYYKKRLKLDYNSLSFISNDMIVPIGGTISIIPFDFSFDMSGKTDSPKLYTVEKIIFDFGILCYNILSLDKSITKIVEASSIYYDRENNEDYTLWVKEEDNIIKYNTVLENIITPTSKLAAMKEGYMPLEVVKFSEPYGLSIQLNTNSENVVTSTVVECKTAKCLNIEDMAKIIKDSLAKRAVAKVCGKYNKVLTCKFRYDIRDLNSSNTLGSIIYNTIEENSSKIYSATGYVIVENYKDGNKIFNTLLRLRGYSKHKVEAFYELISSYNNLMIDIEVNGEMVDRGLIDLNGSRPIEQNDHFNINPYFNIENSDVNPNPDGFVLLQDNNEESKVFSSLFNLNPDNTIRALSQDEQNANPYWNGIVKDNSLYATAAIKISTRVPIVERSEKKNTAGIFITIYNDNKERHNSFEAELNYEIDSNGFKGVSGFGLITFQATGYGANREEALAELDKVYSFIAKKHKEAI